MGGREWELNRWEWEGMGMLKAIPARLYSWGAASSRWCRGGVSCRLHTLLHQSPNSVVSARFRFGLFGGHGSGEIKFDVSCWRSWTVSRARYGGALSCWNTNVLPVMRSMTAASASSAELYGIVFAINFHSVSTKNNSVPPSFEAFISDLENVSRQRRRRSAKDFALFPSQQFKRKYSE